jgi:hypothetical protein
VQDLQTADHISLMTSRTVTDGPLGPVTVRFGLQSCAGHCNWTSKDYMWIHTYEENDWNVKGKFSTAVIDDDEIQWMKIHKDHVLPMWLASYFIIFLKIIQIHFHRKR